MIEVHSSSKSNTIERYTFVENTEISCRQGRISCNDDGTTTLEYLKLVLPIGKKNFFLGIYGEDKLEAMLDAILDMVPKDFIKRYATTLLNRKYDKDGYLLRGKK